VTLANPTTGLSNSGSLALTVNAVSQSHQSSVGGNSGHGGEAGGYSSNSSDWDALMAALDELNQSAVRQALSARFPHGFARFFYAKPGFWMIGLDWSCRLN
ncbi:MAG TPA: hypothetical protein VHX68_15285, partial [Planctomycetaceae bacterium]|nr:hypothetical protein [Planctomycetaceae bacterium]